MSYEDDFRFRAGYAEGLWAGMARGSKQVEHRNMPYSASIDRLNLFVRTYNILCREGVATIGELLACTEARLLQMDNFDKKCLDDVRIAIAQFNYVLRER